jgi:hypothetical protein
MSRSGDIRVSVVNGQLIVTSPTASDCNSREGSDHREPDELSDALHHASFTAAGHGESCAGVSASVIVERAKPTPTEPKVPNSAA